MKKYHAIKFKVPQSRIWSSAILHNNIVEIWYAWKLYRYHSPTRVACNRSQLALSGVRDPPNSLLAAVWLSDFDTFSELHTYSVNYTVIICWATLDFGSDLCLWLRYWPVGYLKMTRKHSSLYLSLFRLLIFQPYRVFRSISVANTEGKEVDELQL